MDKYNSHKYSAHKKNKIAYLTVTSFMGIIFGYVLYKRVFLTD